MNKEEMRKKYREVRKNIVNSDLKDEKIYLKVIGDKDIINKNTILIYVSLPEEVDTLKLIKYFLLTKKVAVPKIENNLINFYYIDSINNLQLGSFNILEPNSNKIVTDFSSCCCITPGICFDYNNYRIGYGKGFYDKFFHEHDVFSIGLCYKECLARKIKINSNDYRVNKVISD